MVRKLVRAAIVLHRTFRHRTIGVRLHALIRFLSCPFLRVLDRIPARGRLLDVGAGHGVFARLARDHGIERAVAVDPDLRKVRKVTGVSMVTGFDSAIRGTFDAITIIDVLYKLPTGEWDALLGRCRDRLSTAGVLVVKEHDPTARFKQNWNRLQEWVATRLGLTLGESFSYEPPDDFVQRLERLGFPRVRAERIDRGYPHAHIVYVARRH